MNTVGMWRRDPDIRIVEYTMQRPEDAYLQAAEDIKENGPYLHLIVDHQGLLVVRCLPGDILEGKLFKALIATEDEYIRHLTAQALVKYGVTSLYDAAIYELTRASRQGISLYFTATVRRCTST
jgi:hypothetical protein